MQDFITLHDIAKIFKTRTKTFEIIYLLYGTKEVSRQIFTNEELFNVTDFCKQNNLFFEVSPRKVNFIDEDEYSELGKFVDETDLAYENAHSMIYISKNKIKAIEACLAELVQDHRKLGLLLSYPACCVKAFSENMKKGKIIEYNLEGFKNISKRQEDWTLISHFPCSNNCKESELIARANYNIILNIDSDLADKIKKNLDLKVLL